jgi:hypothetical protein
MKKFVLLALSAFGLLSCSGDDDNNSTDNVSLTGTWKLTAATLPVGTDFNNDGIASTDFITETRCFNNSTITFTDDVASAILNMQSVDIAEGDDGRFTVNCGGIEESYAPFTVSGSTVTLTSDEYHVPFSKEGNKLTTTKDGALLVFTKL